MYIAIKPQTNSFVFDTDRHPAIFMYLDPTVSPAQLENTGAHELHHIGYAAACSMPGRAPDTTTLAPCVRRVVMWMSAFGEGLAMLAAAGGPDIHPHALDDSATRARWDHDMANAPADLQRLQRFFLDVLDGRLDNPDSVRRVGMSFFGIQGPWYTVGHLMARTIEKTDGHAHLISVICDPRAFIATYNAAAHAAAARLSSSATPLPLWSDAFIARLTAH